jgi:hypothetical protein
LGKTDGWQNKIIRRPLQFNSVLKSDLPRAHLTGQSGSLARALDGGRMKKLIDNLVIYASILSIPELLIWYLKLFSKLIMNEIAQQFLVCATFFSGIAVIVWVWYKIDNAIIKNKRNKKEIERRDKLKEDIKNQIRLLEIEKQTKGKMLLSELSLGKNIRNYDEEIDELKNRLLQ